MSPRAWTLVRVAGVLLVLAFVALLVDGCTPGQRAAIEPGVREGCILLRAVSPSGTIDEVCATADELAPYVSDLLAKREAAELGDVAEASNFVAFSMPTPARRIPRRRCVSWVPVPQRVSYETDGGDSGRR